MTINTLKEFLRLPDEVSSNLKIRMNDNRGESLKRYLFDKDLFEKREVLWYSGKWWFSAGDMFASILKVGDDDWILTSVQRVLRRLDAKRDFIGPAYETEILEEYSQFYGKLHFDFHREAKHQSQVMWYSKLENDLKFSYVSKEPYSGEDFPGCDRVNISYSELQSIFKSHKTTWINGLSNSKAIYLIRDKKTKKMYVGSAASDDEMLLARWRNYATDGHGENKYFKKIVEENGLGYIEENFEYSILEPHDYRADTNFLLEREAFWKRILHTHVDEGGMNFN